MNKCHPGQCSPGSPQTHYSSYLTPSTKARPLPPPPRPPSRHFPLPHPQHVATSPPTPQSGAPLVGEGCLLTQAPKVTLKVPKAPGGSGRARSPGQQHWHLSPKPQAKEGACPWGGPVPEMLFSEPWTASGTEKSDSPSRGLDRAGVSLRLSLPGGLLQRPREAAPQ